MIGLIFLAVFVLYCLVSWAVIASAISYARSHGKSVARWGWGAALIMYLIPFWDWIPTVAIHQFSCANSAGYWEYKSIDEWKFENPGVLETLSRAHLPPNVVHDQWTIGDRFYSYRGYILDDGGVIRPKFDGRNSLMWVEYEGPDGTKGTQLNERFRFFRKKEGPLLFNRWRTEYTIQDAKTGEIVARNVDFSTATEHPFHVGGGNYWKFWLNNNSCPAHYFKDGSIHTYRQSLTAECSKPQTEKRFGDGFSIQCRGLFPRP